MTSCDGAMECDGVANCDGVTACDDVMYRDVVTTRVSLRVTDWSWIGVTLACVTAAMLCKEQGITAVGVCAVYEVFVVRKVRFSPGMPLEGCL